MLGHRAKERNEIFNQEYSKVINKFTNEFTSEYCDSEGNINWKKIVEINSGKKKNKDLIY